MAPRSLPATERLIKERIGVAETHGIAITLFDANSVLFEGHWGYQDIEHRTPFGAGTLVPVGSLTKLLTAVAVQQEEESGRLDMDAPCVTYLPELQELLPSSVTIRHLLAHKSGLASTGYFEDQLQVLQGHGPLRASAHDFPTFVSHHLTKSAQVAPPGRRFLYSNEGYLLLGEIVQRTSQMRFPDHLATHVFKPLDLGDYLFTGQYWKKNQRVARPYLHIDGTFMPSDYADDFIGSAGGLVTNSRTYARVLSALLEASRDGNTLLPQRRAKEILASHADIHPSSPRIEHSLEGVTQQYGQGVRRYPEFPDGGLVHHSGSLLTANAFFALHETHQVGVVAIANGSAFPLEDVCLTALTEHLGYRLGNLRYRIAEAATRSVEGIYETQSGALAANVTPFETGFTLDFLHRRIPRRHYLAPVAITEQSALYRDPFSNPPLTADFHLGERTSVTFDRYHFVRVHDS